MWVKVLEACDSTFTISIISDKYGRGLGPHVKKEFVLIEFKVRIPTLTSELRWPSRANAQHLKKTHANRQNTSNLRKHLHQFNSTSSAFTNTHSKYRNAANVENKARRP